MIDKYLSVHSMAVSLMAFDLLTLISGLKWQVTWSSPPPSSLRLGLKAKLLASTSGLMPKFWP